MSGIDTAIAAAKKAAHSWSLHSDRLQIILRFGELLSAHKEEMALVISQEVGKPLWESRGEVAAMLGKIPISIEAHRERCPDWEKQIAQGTLSVTHRPRGICGVLGPFNFPGHLPNGHIVPALIAGNVILFKPSEQTPRTGQMMCELWHQAGLPDGVLQLIEGGPKEGKELASHPDLDALFFTGSAQTGTQLAADFAKDPQKCLALEMGGNSPLVVADVADEAAAVYAIINSAFITSGQRCTCARRLIIVGDTYIVPKLQHIIPQLIVDQYDATPEPFMGPMIHKAAAQQVVNTFNKLIDIGGTPLVPPTGTPPLITPSLIDVTNVANRPDEECFGPLLQLIHVNTIEEAIAEANNTRFGLAAALISDNYHFWEQFKREINAGVINWNTPTTGASSAAPFGGVGLSGNCRPSAYYAADYCAYPVASVTRQKVTVPTKLNPGLPHAWGDSLL